MLFLQTSAIPTNFSQVLTWCIYFDMAKAFDVINIDFTVFILSFKFNIHGTLLLY